jgi:hypothetical protein
MVFVTLKTNVVPENFVMSVSFLHLDAIMCEVCIFSSSIDSVSLTLGIC